MPPFCLASVTATHGNASRPVDSNWPHERSGHWLVQAREGALQRARPGARGPGPPKMHDGHAAFTGRVVSSRRCFVDPSHSL
jgi:hypothetical protein